MEQSSPGPLAHQPATGQSPTVRHAVVVGGGVAGLVAARDLARAGVRVAVMEAADQLGGQIRTIEVAGRTVDAGAEALFAAPPHLKALVTELGLWDQALGSHAGTTLFGHPRGAQPMPEGLGPAGPTRIAPVLRSRLLSWPAKIRAGLEPLVARLAPPLPAEQDISVGAFISSRFGSAVARRTVDPLLGSLHSGDIDRLSLRGTAPQLVPAAEGNRPLLKRHPVTARTSGPAFVTWAGGLTTLVDALVADIEAHGGSVGTGMEVRQVVPLGRRWQVRTSVGSYETDAVVLATPSVPMAAILGTLRSRVAEELRMQRTAYVANTFVALRADQAFAGDRRWPLRADRDTNGILMPSDSPFLLKAAVFLGTKWPHLATNAAGHDDNLFLVRMSAGRVGQHVVEDLDDAELTARLMDDLRRTTGVGGEIMDSRVVRWPAVAQCEVGQPARMESVRADLARHLPGLHLAGGGVDGIGLSSVVRSGQHAAAEIVGPAAAGRSGPTTMP